MITCADVTRAVSAYFGRQGGELFGRQRDPELVRERHIAWYLASKVAYRDVDTIAHEMGDYDRVTVWKGIALISDRVLKEPSLAADVAVLNWELTGRDYVPQPKFAPPPPPPKPVIAKAKAAVAAWKSIEEARFTPGERAARTRFETTMKALESAVEGA